MSTLWTPGGERPIRRDPPSESESAPAAAPPGGVGGGREPTEAELREQMEALQDQLARTPAEVVVANHAFGLFELAALHLSLRPPQLGQARTAIDAMGALVEGMSGRLGESEDQLVEGLGQLRMAFVQLRATSGTASEGDQPGGGAAASDDAGYPGGSPSNPPDR
jgi:hypothetical protein